MSGCGGVTLPGNLPFEFKHRAFVPGYRCGHLISSTKRIKRGGPTLFPSPVEARGAYDEQTDSCRVWPVCTYGRQFSRDCRPAT